MEGRYELSKKQFELIADLLPGKVGDRGRTAADNYLFINGVMWGLRSGSFWRDMPPRYGNWKSHHKRFTRWAQSGVWEKAFERLIKDPKNFWVMIDSTLVKAHQQASGKKGAREQAVGRSRGGLTTKIHMLADALGRPLRFIQPPNLPSVSYSTPNSEEPFPHHRGEGSNVIHAPLFPQKTS